MVVADNARAEAQSRYQGDWDPHHGEPVDDFGFSDAERRAFVAGAEWAAGRAETTAEAVEDAARVIDVLGRHWWSTQTGETEPWGDLTDAEKANVIENAYIDVLATPVLGLLATARTDTASAEDVRGL